MNLALYGLKLLKKYWNIQIKIWFTACKTNRTEKVDIYSNLIGLQAIGENYRDTGIMWQIDL